MSDNIKLIVEISKSAYEEMSKHGTDRVDYDIQQMIKNGIPLDDVKAEIDYERNRYLNLVGDSGYCNGLNKALKIIDNIGKESEDEV